MNDRKWIPIRVGVRGVLDGVHRRDKVRVILTIQMFQKSIHHVNPYHNR